LSNIEAAVGQTAVLEAEIAGNPIPLVKWYLNFIL
jgi:hypothetical protein